MRTEHREDCERKRRYVNRQEARRARAAYRTRQHYKLDVYHCAHCGGFHLGRSRN